MNIKNQSSLKIINKVFNFIIKQNFIFKNKNILLSFSGGQDSLCLLILMLNFRNQFNYVISSIYMDHFWRLKNLYKLSHLLKISYLINQKIFFTIPNQKIFNEKKSRIWRYSVSYRVSLFYDYEILLTGHTLTDQIETLLLNLFRGSTKQSINSLFINQFIVNRSVKNIFLSKEDLN